MCEWQVNKTIQLNESEPILAAAEYFNVKKRSFKEAVDGDVPVGFVEMKQLVLKKSFWVWKFRDAAPHRETRGHVLRFILMRSSHLKR